MAEKENKKSRKVLKIFGIIVLMLVLFIAGMLGGAYWYVNDKLGKMQQVEIKEETEDEDINQYLSSNLQYPYFFVY